MSAWLRTNPDGSPVYGREQVAHLDHVTDYWREKHAADAARREARQRRTREHLATIRERHRANRARDAAMLSILIQHRGLGQ